MGYLAASTGTLFAAYAVYSATARYVSRRNARQVEIPTLDVQAGEGNDHTLEKPTTPTPPQPSSPANLSVSSPPPVFAVSPPSLTLHGDLNSVKSSIPSSTTLMAPPPPPATRSTNVPRPNPTPMAPPPLPTLRSSTPPRLKPPSSSAPPRLSNNVMGPPPFNASTLRVPQTKALSNTHMQPASSTLGVPSKKARSKQITLLPGYSPLDWAALTTNPASTSPLRGKDATSLSLSSTSSPHTLLRIPPSRLKIQTGRKGKDAWTVYQGKVYNITPYLPFHPGGEAEIMKGAGRDSAELFMEVHPWVNWDGMLGECLVGILVAEEDSAGGGNELDEMD